VSASTPQSRRLSKASLHPLTAHCMDDIDTLTPTQDTNQAVVSCLFGAIAFAGVASSGSFFVDHIYIYFL